MKESTDHCTTGLCYVLFETMAIGMESFPAHETTYTSQIIILRVDIVDWIIIDEE